MRGRHTLVCTETISWLWPLYWEVFQPHTHFTVRWAPRKFISAVMLIKYSKQKMHCMHMNRNSRIHHFAEVKWDRDVDRRRCSEFKAMALWWLRLNRMSDVAQHNLRLDCVNWILSDGHEPRKWGFDSPSLCLTPVTRSLIIIFVNFWTKP